MSMGKANRRSKHPSEGFTRNQQKTHDDNDGNMKQSRINTNRPPKPCSAKEDSIARRQHNTKDNIQEDVPAIRTNRQSNNVIIRQRLATNVTRKELSTTLIKNDIF